MRMTIALEGGGLWRGWRTASVGGGHIDQLESDCAGVTHDADSDLDLTERPAQQPSPVEGAFTFLDLLLCRTATALVTSAGARGRHRRPSRASLSNCASIFDPVSADPVPPAELVCPIPCLKGISCTPRNCRARSAAYSAPLCQGRRGRSCRCRRDPRKGLAS